MYTTYMKDMEVVKMKTKEKAVKHVFVLEGKTYTRSSPRVYTHIVVGDDATCHHGAGHVHDEYCNRTGLDLGWSQSEVNAEKNAQTMRNRGFKNVRVYMVKREVR